MSELYEKQVEGETTRFVARTTTDVVANPSFGNPTEDLESLRVGETDYKVGTKVVANPTGLATNPLKTVQIDGENYKVFQNARLPVVTPGNAGETLVVSEQGEWVAQPQSGGASWVEVTPTELMSLMTAENVGALVKMVTFNYYYVNGDSMPASIAPICKTGSTTYGVFMVEHPSYDSTELIASGQKITYTRRYIVVSKTRITRQAYKTEVTVDFDNKSIKAKSSTSNEDIQSFTSYYKWYIMR